MSTNRARGNPRKPALPALLVILAFVLPAAPAGPSTDPAWPETSSQTRPWAYWWWMGSAVDKENLKALLRGYRDSGLGGLHIIPIYRARGYEDRAIPFLSEEWMEMLAFTIEEAGKLGLGIDMTTGTGWPFGGPTVGPENAAARFVMEERSFEGGRFELEVRKLVEKPGASLAAAVAFSSGGSYRELRERDGWIRARLPEGPWKVYLVIQEPLGKEVERAAPGGEGLAIDYFSSDALKSYLSLFDRAFAAFENLKVRAFYNDSYEVHGANWTEDFFSEFERRRGYDLKRHLEGLAGDAAPEENSRVRADYRETLSDLLLDEFMIPWVNWSHEKGALTRNEAHGMPGNLLDLYGASDIPETEQFGPSGFPIPGLRIDETFSREDFGKPEKLLYQFASSAAHVSGRQLVSSESCTWLGEHFRVSLSQVKPEIDQLFLGGINHVLYHGIAYSPVDEKWPGWLYYASTNFGPTNPFWRHLPALNEYISRTQAFLQSGQPANDILLYFPAYDMWYALDGLEKEFSVHRADEWLHPFPVSALARTLNRMGYSFDLVSDRQLQRASVRSGRIITSSMAGQYRVVLVPKARFMPATTLRRLKELAEGGASVLYVDALPQDVPGLGNLTARRKHLAAARNGLDWKVSERGVSTAEIGKGRWILGSEVTELLGAAGVPREKLTDLGLDYIRRTSADGPVYFLANLGEARVDGWAPLSTEAEEVVLFDTLHRRAGRAAIKKGAEGIEIYLQLEPGESLVAKGLQEGASNLPEWPYRGETGSSLVLQGEWSVEFLEGGPALPEAVQTDRLASWTEFGGKPYREFSGTALYSIRFERPESKADFWLLDLGKVAESARVSLNGKPIGTAFSLPFRLRVDDEDLQASNRLDVEIANLGANRIAALDRGGADWKKFYDINFVNIRYRPFDASGWPPMESGLIGPVRLLPVDRLRPETGN